MFLRIYVSSSACSWSFVSLTHVSAHRQYGWREYGLIEKGAGSKGKDCRNMQAPADIVPRSRHNRHIILRSYKARVTPCLDYMLPGSRLVPITYNQDHVLFQSHITRITSCQDHMSVLEPVVRGFSPVLLQWEIVSALKIKAKIHAISTMSDFVAAELSLRTTWHTTCCT